VTKQVRSSLRRRKLTNFAAPRVTLTSIVLFVACGGRSNRPSHDGDGTPNGGCESSTCGSAGALVGDAVAASAGQAGWSGGGNASSAQAGTAGTVSPSGGVAASFECTVDFNSEQSCRVCRSVALEGSCKRSWEVLESPECEDGRRCALDFCFCDEACQGDSCACVDSCLRIEDQCRSRWRDLLECLTDECGSECS
jgi:hypothetical protein